MLSVTNVLVDYLNSLYMELQVPLTSKVRMFRL
uniref:Uncharacterized protein n=1 Tax=Podoviridae sp. ctZkC8 TaxID=2825259 RepID=A0A8S5UBG9_9CAUD|nr:MAG TPA: hypothetical protein [Podoviridae sp. ctZkC8]